MNRLRSLDLDEKPLRLCWVAAIALHVLITIILVEEAVLACPLALPPLVA